MADWNPELYARYADERLRPVVDILARVPLAKAARILDVGCGAGASTAPLVEHFAGSEVLGIDTSPAMIDKARQTVPGARFEIADGASFGSDTPFDLVFSNATLQWIPDHQRLLPHLMGLLAPEGVLAVQMPDTLDEPSHVLMREVAAEPPFAAALAGAEGARTRLLSFEATWDALAPSASTIEQWRTTYVHPFDGVGRIVEMLRSTGLKTFLDPLGEADRAAFLARYEARLAAAYPATADGHVLFRFPRRFFVAVRA